jgi:NtrC-family two-component system sensor histidine kinase KinB
MNSTRLPLLPLMLTLRSRLLLAFAVILVSVFIGFVIIVVGTIALSGSPERIVDKYYSSILAADRMKQAVQAQQNAILRKLLSPDYDAVAALDKAHNEFTAWLARAKTSITLAEEGDTVATIEKRYAALQQVIADRASWAGTYPWETGVVEAFRNVISGCEHLSQINVGLMTEVSAGAHEYVRMAVLAAAVAVSMILIVGIWVSLNLAKRLSEPLEQMVEGVRRITSGDYQVNLQPSAIKEIAQLTRQFNTMARALQTFREMNLERTLNEQRQSEAVLRSIDDGLVIFGDDGCIRRLNPVAVRQLGLAPDVCIGRRLGELLDDASIDSAVRHCLGLDHDAGTSLHELQLDNTGTRRYLAYSVLPISDEQERRHGAVMVLRDVTEHKAFEQMRNEFVMRASHELRTPVTSIRMGIGLLSEKMPFAAASREQELLETVSEELTRLMNLVNDLFDLSRFQAGRKELERADCDVRELLEAAAQRFALKAAAGDVAVLVDDDSRNLPAVSIDRTQIERVLDNLISNALRHTAGGGRIELRARRQGERLRLEVADTGSGIAYSDQTRIFEPFVQAADHAGGAGLGLAISREIIQHHDGTIRLSSRPGHGTTFTIELPQMFS